MPSRDEPTAHPSPVAARLQTYLFGHSAVATINRERAAIHSTQQLPLPSAYWSRLPAALVPPVHPPRAVSVFRSARVRKALLPPRKKHQTAPPHQHPATTKQPDEKVCAER